MCEAVPTAPGLVQAARGLSAPTRCQAGKSGAKDSMKRKWCGAFVMSLRRLLCIAVLACTPMAAAQDAAQSPAKPSAAKPAVPAKKPDVPKSQPQTQPEAAPDETAPDETKPAAPEPSLPLPRFVSFRTDPVNLRTGPGVRYPVEWIYMRRRLPVEIIAEFETWRQIRDPDGAQGWVHQSMLSGRRTAFVTGEARALRKTNVAAGETLAMLEPGVVVDIQRCPADGPFCRVEAAGLQGWLKRDELWGVYPDEKIE